MNAARFATLDSALAKLEAAAGEAGAVSERVSVVLETQDRALAVARAAVEAKRRLHLVYHVSARDETTERDVDPMRVLLVEGRAYLEAWCRRAAGVRLFRLDRVVDIAMLDLPADPPPEATPRDLSAGLFHPSEGDEVVTLQLSPAARWVADYYPCERVDELPDGTCLATLRTPEPRWVRRLALRLGETCRVLGPPTLAGSVREEALAALDAYQRAGSPSR